MPLSRCLLSSVHTFSRDEFWVNGGMYMFVELLSEDDRVRLGSQMVEHSFLVAGGSDVRVGSLSNRQSYDFDCVHLGFELEILEEAGRRQILCWFWLQQADVGLWKVTDAGFLRIVSESIQRYLLSSRMCCQVCFRIFLAGNFNGSTSLNGFCFAVVDWGVNRTDFESCGCELMVVCELRSLLNIVFIRQQFYRRVNQFNHIKALHSNTIIWIKLRYLNTYNQQQTMGSLCTPANQQMQPNVSPSQAARIPTVIHDPQYDKICEIKDFLTLTSQNTYSFFQIKAEQPTQTQSIKSTAKRNKIITDFKVIRGLGKGAFGQVFMVKDIEENKFYAMKIIHKDSITCSQDKINTLSERYILEAMSHPFIVKLHYAFQSASKLYLLCDLMAGGELFYLLRRNKKFPEEVAKFYAAEILLAIEYLHSRNIIYRDLKPENILLDQQGHIKITDFGLSKVCFSDKQMTFSICGTPEYIAPEVMMGKGYTQMADWFSFGSLLYDMLTGKPPFYSTNKNQILKKITSKPVPIPQNLSPQAKSLLRGLFKIKPKDRLGYHNGASEIKNHEFFSNVNFDQLLHKKVEPPISFKETINNQGFDMDFPNNNSYESTINIEKATKERGLIFDGFTYYKPEVNSPKKMSSPINPNHEQILQNVQDAD